MNADQRKRFVAEMERRFRSRTPTMDANYANPDTRVGRSEMVSWMKENGIPEMSIVDTVEDEALVRDIKRFWRRMRKEFPEERWS